MIILMGDLHGSFMGIRELSDKVPEGEDIKLIQVGDFGFYPEVLKSWTSPKFPVYAIDGNHEHFPMLRGIRDVKEIRENLFYVPRGTILEMEGLKIGFCGGGFSPDQGMRTPGVDWHPDEEVRLEDIQPLLNAEHLDVIITHTPPKTLINAVFGPLDHKSWGLDPKLQDTSAEVMDILWEKYPLTPWYCGHMHRSVHHANIRILSIFEVLELKV